ncbi:carboxymuconolactone decarboxylase family protein [Corynebacterium aquatimens]|uniref:AhpD family alkylhydroperoxidase n=1 Tax=Corynebacterium aquatimens TaxID=1190508 RepID=A0A931GT41_9CORY|nr:carboxymuconolactone decarboxylase family protein [Corynebacterium aquatimens]MBG6122637.1 AhpD family alkylhydroperoxidase [Corynebacterium aquatimens]WJY64823.1 Carboxymuconolactone decarboxylase family protein [Corynebacterium aquatimens]
MQFFEQNNLGSDFPLAKLPVDSSTRPGPGRGKEIAVLARVADKIGGLVQGSKTLNLFPAIGRARRNFLPWLLYSGMLMPFGILSRKESELIILRVAALRGATYELEHHKKLGKKAGLSNDEIARVQRQEHGFDGRTKAVLDAADDVVRYRQVSDEVWARLADRLSDKEITALLLLVTNYDGLATVMDVLNIPLDEPR